MPYALDLLKPVNIAERVELIEGRVDNFNKAMSFDF